MVNAVSLKGLTYMRSLEAEKSIVENSSLQFQQVLKKTMEEDKIDENENLGQTSSSYVEPQNLTSVKAPEAMEAYFQEAEEKYGVPVALLKAVAKAESSFRVDAVSSAGAQGVMQLMPATAQGLGVEDCFNAKENILGGAKYLSGMLTKYNGSVKLALAAYNAGSGNVDKYNGVPPFEETKNYIKRIFGYLGVGMDGNAFVNEKKDVPVSNVEQTDNSVKQAESTNQTDNNAEVALQLAQSILNASGSQTDIQQSEQSSLYSALASQLSSSSGYMNLLNGQN